jgi:malate dehydrogenase (oxaloacetate-decarboxylating)(NADP+)
VRANPRRVVFAEGEEEKTIRAAIAFRNAGYGTPVLIGREERVLDTLRALGINGSDGIEIHNARLSGANRKYADYLYARQQRRGFLFRDCQRLVNQDRNVFAACMVACGDADAMVTGLSRSYAVSLEGVRLAIDPAPGHLLFGISLLLTSQGTVLVADTAIHERPDAGQLAAIAKATAAAARRMGREPRVAFLSFSTFGDPKGSIPESIREAVALLDQRRQDFEYDGEMAADVALDPALQGLYPFCRLTGPANVLVMPGLHAAHILTKALPRLSSATVIGPILQGLSRPAQIVPLDAPSSTIVLMAGLAAYQSLAR